MAPLFAFPLAILLIAPPPIAPDSEILKILQQRIDQYHWGVGMVVGVIEPGGNRRLVAYGKLDQNDPRTLNGDTVFEIGSITKVFTSLLLADAVQQGEVAFDDPISKYLPEDVSTPERKGRSITLADLSSHTSGLPQVFGNPDSQDEDNPYTGYTVQQLYNFISNFQLRRDIGSKFEYSNMGAGLLGHLLARRAATAYETLIEARITGPLGLKDTRITLTPEMNERRAVGHGPSLRAVAPWDMPTLSAAGALRSTTNDMLNFLAAELGYTRTPLASAMASMLEKRVPVGDPRGTEVGLGWFVYKRNGKEIVEHGGDTTGFQSAIAFDRQNGSGVVVLSNSSSAFHQVADIAMHLLNPDYSLERPAPVETEIDPPAFDRHVGKYELQSEPKLVLTFTREDNRFFIQAAGQDKLELFAENENDFFLKVTDAQITFESGGLILHQNGFDERGNRIE